MQPPEEEERGGGRGALASLTPKRWKIEIYSLFLPPPPPLSPLLFPSAPPPPISTQTRERGAVSGEEGGRGDTLFGINSRISEEVGKGRGGGGGVRVNCVAPPLSPRDMANKW